MSELSDLAVKTFGFLPAWGVVSTDAVDSFYGGDWTYAQAKKFAEEEAKRPLRTAIVVLSVEGVGEK